MTRQQALESLATLEAQRVTGGMTQTAWTSWAIEAERLFALAFAPSDTALLRYRTAVGRYAAREGHAYGLQNNLLGAFDACRAILESAPGPEIEARLSGIPASMARQPQAGHPAIRVFISHASADAALAEMVVKLLRSALGLAPTAIRCTSVDGHRLAGGADIDDEIRREVQQAEAVIGILSGSSLGSLYVAFELGARWGVDRPLIPLMAPGFLPGAIKGPLSGKNALAAGNASQLHDLVDELGKQLGITPHPASSYQSELKAIVSLADVHIAKAESAAGHHIDIPVLPAGFELHDGIVWDMRSGAAVPYCEGCRTGSGKLVGLSVFEQGASPLLMVKTYTCPHNHPQIVFGVNRWPPMTRLQAEAAARQINALMKPR